MQAWLLWEDGVEELVHGQAIAWTKRGRGADRQLPHLLRLQAPGLTLGEAWTFGHSPRVSNKRSGP